MVRIGLIHKSEVGLVAKISKDHLQLSSKKDEQFNNEYAKDLDTSPKRYRLK